MNRPCLKCGGLLDTHSYDFAMNCLTCGALYYYTQPDYTQPARRSSYALRVIKTRMAQYVASILRSQGRAMTAFELVEEITTRYPDQRASLRYVRQTLSVGVQFKKADWGYWTLDPLYDPC